MRTPIDTKTIAWGTLSPAHEETWERAQDWLSDYGIDLGVDPADWAARVDGDRIAFKLDGAKPVAVIVTEDHDERITVLSVEVRRV